MDSQPAKGWNRGLDLVNCICKPVLSDKTEVYVESKEENKQGLAVDAVFAKEVEKDVEICRGAAAVVRSVFAAAKEGRELSLDPILGAAEAIAESAERRPDALVAVARQKDRGDYAAMHAVAVGALMSALANKMGLGRASMRNAAVAGLLMDIGMASLPGAVLGKPGALSDSVREMVRSHASGGGSLLMLADAPKEAVQACLGHHERFDGNGYPAGLFGEGIPKVARMAAICDAYDAMTSDRPYKAGLSPADALSSMAQCRHTQFDPKIFEVFESVVGIYPVGTLVKLTSKRLAVVVEQTESLLHPVVKDFFDSESMEPIAEERLELSAQGGEKIIGKEDQKGYDFGDIDSYWRF